jgi:ABC-type multidrug transport system ATPase subunit
VSDVEAVATRIAIMNKGHLLQHVTPEELLQSVDGKTWEWVIPTSQLAAVRENYIISTMNRYADVTRLRIIQELSPSADATQVDPNLEDAYLLAVSTNSHGAAG